MTVAVNDAVAPKKDSVIEFWESVIVVATGVGGSVPPSDPLQVVRPISRTVNARELILEYLTRHPY